ncbi:shikimate kinase [mine drainage metagenome]|uniref:shikimate kinase n=1 Tax=mine drainage metagenome TaxID=410659 RepID=A0A1J5PS04_9ZZZZ
MPDQTIPASPLPADGPAPRVVLVGPPGSGKSTVATALARHWGVAVRDTDADVEDAAGKPIREIFVDDGEAVFRAWEHDAVLRALREHEGVLALGGGAVLDPATQEGLSDYRARGGTVVFLDVSLRHAAPRVGFATSRPLLLGNPRAQWQQLMDARRGTYEAVSDMRLLTDDQTPEEVAAQIDAELAARDRGATAGATGNNEEPA